MKMKRFVIVVALAFVSMVSMAQHLKANMDQSVKPGEDFWQYAVGSWLKNNPLDKEHPMNGAFIDLEELNKKRINALIMKYADQKDLPQGSDGQKIGALYRLYMDSVSRNKMGYEPIQPYLKQVRAIKTREEALKLMCDFDAKGFNTAPFGMSLSLNPYNSSEYKCRPWSCLIASRVLYRAQRAAAGCRCRHQKPEQGLPDDGGQQQCRCRAYDAGSMGHRIQDWHQDTEPGGSARPAEDHPHHAVGAVVEGFQWYRLDRLS